MIEQIRAFFAKLVPVNRVTVHDPRRQLTGVAASIDAGRVHTIFEQADSGDPRELFALYQEILLGDSHLQAEFSKRKLAVLGDAFTVQAAGDEDPADAAAADFARAQVEACAGWIDACRHLLDSTLWPVAVVEKVFRPRGPGFDLAALVPVPDQLLDWSAGRLRIRATNADGLETGEFHDADTGRYLIHRGHLLGFADFRGGPLRSLVWWWLLTTMDREWWGRFLDRYGSPFLVGKYDQADDASRSILERAFSYATRIGGLVVSRDTEVELKQALSADAGDAFEQLWTIGCREKSKLVLGQTSSAESQAQGIGSGASQQHEAVRGDIRAWDAARLGDTIRTGLFAQLLRINGLPGRPPRPVWGADDAGATQTGTLLESLHRAGLRVTDDGLKTVSARLGLPVERQAAAPSPFGGALSLGARVIPLASAPIVGAEKAGASVARAGAADLARAFGGAFAPVRAAILESSSPDELRARLVTLYADWPAGRVATLLEEALAAYSANRILAE